MCSHEDTLKRKMLRMPYSWNLGSQPVGHPQLGSVGFYTGRTANPEGV